MFVPNTLREVVPDLSRLNPTNAVLSGSNGVDAAVGAGADGAAGLHSHLWADPRNRSQIHEWENLFRDTIDVLARSYEACFFHNTSAIAGATLIVLTDRSMVSVP